MYCTDRLQILLTFCSKHQLRVYDYSDANNHNSRTHHLTVLDDLICPRRGSSSQPMSMERLATRRHEHGSGNMLCATTDEANVLPGQKDMQKSRILDPEERLHRLKDAPQIRTRSGCTCRSKARENQPLHWILSLRPPCPKTMFLVGFYDIVSVLLRSSR